jgi:hypothetical protein
MPDLPSIEPIREYSKGAKILRDNEPLFPVFSESSEEIDRDLGIPRL